MCYALHLLCVGGRYQGNNTIIQGSCLWSKSDSCGKTQKAITKLMCFSVFSENLLFAGLVYNFHEHLVSFLSLSDLFISCSSLLCLLRPHNWDWLFSCDILCFFSDLYAHSTRNVLYCPCLFFFCFFLYFRTESIYFILVLYVPFGPISPLIMLWRWTIYVCWYLC